MRRLWRESAAQLEGGGKNRVDCGQQGSNSNESKLKLNVRRTGGYWRVSLSSRA